MRRGLLILLVLVSSNPVEAHLGNENNTEIRLFSDKMRMVIRTSIPFAWSLLGERAPAAADEPGQAIARPLLIEAAPGLMTVTAGGKPLSPTQVDCMFEVGKDVAFILTFNRPDEWPVVVEANFFDRLTSLDTGTISVFDYTASRFSRDLKPIAEQIISQGETSISFSLVAPVDKPSAPPPAPAVEQPVAQPLPKPIIWAIVLASLCGVYVVWKLRGSRA